MIFETERLILRPWEEGDAAELYKQASDPRVGPSAGWLPHTSVENSRDVIKNILSAPETYAVVLKETGLPVGSIGFHRNDLAAKDDEYELGYWIGAPYWGRGLIPEAAREMLRHAFLDLGLERVWCGYYDGNDKSKRVQEKLGFTYQWTTDDLYVRQLGETRKGHVNLLTREEWEKAQNRAGCAVYVHGMGGAASEAEHYKSLFPRRRVLGFDYKSGTPAEAVTEFSGYFAEMKEKYGSVVLIANSLGAYFSFVSGVDRYVDRAYFISPVVDMEAIILGMMELSGVTETELEQKGVINTENGVLSREYLRFVRENPAKWSASASILYGENDSLQTLDAVRRFADRVGADLTVMKNGEHWFHTEEQMRFLDSWIEKRNV